MTNIKAVDVSEIEKLVFSDKPLINADALRALLDRSPSVSAPTIPEGMVLVPVTINRDDKEFRLISNNYGTVSDISMELKVYFDTGALSAYKGSDKDEN